MAVTPNYYETLYITRPDIQEEELAKIQQKILDSISAHQGEIIKADKWAERGLAYEIQDHKRGIYYILVFKALPSACAEIEKHLSFYNTDILRFITLKVTEEAVNKEKAAREKAAEKAEAQKAEAQAQKAESVEEPVVEITAEVEVTEGTPETDKVESVV
ncbi:MAG: 30S ribosomal protein S6, partial [Deltaproteobacteria bacterium]|nr:30S ribosomal protein S6 [Deltaproteobacteria bacterium]